MARLRKTLSREFIDYYYSHPLEWTAEDVQTAKTMLSHCEPDAYVSPSFKETVLFLYVPIELIEWSIERGADVNWTATYGTALFKHAGMGDVDVCRLLLDRGADVNIEAYDGSTALHAAAFRGQCETIRLLVEHGADPCRRTKDMWGGRTPLIVMLESYEGMMKMRFAQTAELLVALERRLRPIPEDEWEKARSQVERIGRQYQVFRSDWRNPDEIAEGDEAMSRMYALFDVQPAPVITRHDGRQEIVVDETLPLEESFRRLHDFLVPLADAPLTLQGEVVRIAGAVDDEASANGGLNWNSSFTRSLKDLVRYLACGNTLDDGQLAEAEELARRIVEARGTGCWDETARLKALAVAWVQRNPQPIIPQQG